MWVVFFSYLLYFLNRYREDHQSADWDHVFLFIIDEFLLTCALLLVQTGHHKSLHISSLLVTAWSSVLSRLCVSQMLKKANSCNSIEEQTDLNSKR